MLLPAAQQGKAVPIKSLASLSGFAGCSNELPVMKKGKRERNYSSFFPSRGNSVQGRFHEDPLASLCCSELHSVKMQLQEKAVEDIRQPPTRGGGSF